MDPLHREIIRENYLLLAELIKTSVENVVLFLFQHKIISEHMKEDILESNTMNRDKATALLDLIQTRGPRAYDSMYNALLEAELWDACVVLKPEEAKSIRQMQSDPNN